MFSEKPISVSSGYEVEYDIMSGIYTITCDVSNWKGISVAWLTHPEEGIRLNCFKREI